MTVRQSVALRRHPEVEQYAIVDDDPDMLPEQSPFFVKTDGFNGLMWGDFEKLCGLFGVATQDCAPDRFRIGSTVKLEWTDEVPTPHTPEIKP